MIRRGRLSDAPRAVELLRDSRTGAGFDKPGGVSGFTFPFDESYAERLFLHCITSIDALCIFYCVDGLPVGVFMGTASEYELGPVKIGFERVFWVDPSHRGVGLKLIREFESWAKGRGCEFTLTTGKRDQRYEKVISRLGYQPIETHHIKRL